MGNVLRLLESYTVQVMRQEEIVKSIHSCSIESVYFSLSDISSEGVFYDGADEESSPIELQSPTETLACASPLRVAPSDGPMNLIRDNHSSVRYKI